MGSPNMQFGPAEIVGALVGFGWGIRYLLQRNNGGTQRERIAVIDDRLARLETKVDLIYQTIKVKIGGE